MKPLLLAFPLLLAGCVSTDTAQPPKVFVAPDPVTGVPTPYVTTNNGVFATDLKATPFKGN